MRGPWMLKENRKEKRSLINCSHNDDGNGNSHTNGRIDRVDFYKYSNSQENRHTGNTWQPNDWKFPHLSRASLITSWRRDSRHCKELPWLWCRSLPWAASPIKHRNERFASAACMSLAAAPHRVPPAWTSPSPAIDQEERATCCFSTLPDDNCYPLLIYILWYILCITFSWTNVRWCSGHRLIDFFVICPRATNCAPILYVENKHRNSNIEIWQECAKSRVDHWGRSIVRGALAQHKIVHEHEQWHDLSSSNRDVLMLKPYGKLLNPMYIGSIISARPMKRGFAAQTHARQVLKASWRSASWWRLAHRSASMWFCSSNLKIICFSFDDFAPSIFDL